jgi:DNA-binding XRE family transcriptional regulator
MRECKDCKTNLVAGTHTIPTRIGSYIVDGNAQCEACPKCDYYEIMMKDGLLLELRAAQVVLHEAEKINGEVLKFARKAAGLSKEDLAKKLELSKLTIEQYESDQLPFLPTYPLALAGLLSHAERSLLGQNIGYIKK